MRTLTFDEYAYNNLGRAYWEMRDYPKAAEAFRKQIRSAYAQAEASRDGDTALVYS